jgi:hypothetical protein
MNAQRTQALFDQFASDCRLQANAAEAEMSVELMTVPARDAELQLLESLRQQMNAERERFTEAAVKLGKDRAKLEVHTCIFHQPPLLLRQIELCTGRESQAPG